jgi:TolB-like protein
MSSVWGELRRRNVVKVAIAYAVVGWLLIEISSTILPIFAAPQWAVQTVTFVIILGFPLALIFAWAFELTPEGLKKEKDIDRSKSLTHVAGRRLDFIIISVLVLAVIYLGFDKFVLDPARDFEVATITTDGGTGQTDDGNGEGAAAKSIAVLAFDDLSPDGDQEYFSDGVSEEILNSLAQIPDLHVTSRSSAFSYKGKGVDIRTVAEQLGVANVLEGSVRKSGNRVRITAQLIDARTDAHVWSETYERDLEDIFALQDEISAAIVNALTDRLGLSVEAAPRATSAANIEAHEAYLRGQHLLAQSTVASSTSAIGEFENAIALDPEYALAYAGLAIATLNSDLEYPEVITRSQPFVENAMALDPALAESHAAKGRWFMAQAMWDNALVSLRRAIEINPNYVIVYVWMGNIFDFDLGRYSEAFEMRRAAMRLDPLSIPTIVRYQQALIQKNELEEAARELEKIAAIYPQVYAYREGTRTSRDGNLANAILGSLEALRIDPEFTRVKEGLTYHLAQIGLGDEALAMSQRPRAIVLSYLGRTRDAVALAEQYVDEFPGWTLGRQDLGLALAGAGDYARARPILEELWQESGGIISKRSDWIQPITAAALITTRRETDENADVADLVLAIRDNVRRYREAGIVGDGRTFGVDYEEGLAEYLSGNREKGLALLDKAAQDGVFILPNEAYLQPLYADPGFAPILARQKTRQMRERSKVLAVVCENNPYEVVWQPAEETCEKFFAGSMD